MGWLSGRAGATQDEEREAGPLEEGSSQLGLSLPPEPDEANVFRKKIQCSGQLLVFVSVIYW